MHRSPPGAVVTPPEDFAGVPLEQLLDDSMSVESFLPLAIQLADAVAELHARGIIHKGLRPSGVFVNTATRQLKLANLASATRIPWQQPEAGDMVLPAGMLPYMAPEQTGRMNRAIDFRTDLYALGVMFYRMLAGRLPFAADDPMEWVHCHIARTQSPLTELHPELPRALSDIVDKLLAKMADHRYQTAAGLRTDLETCLRWLSESGRIGAFALGTADVSSRLIVPQRLYGREREVEALMEMFERVVRTHSCELALVVGYSGIGKSALVQELYRPIIRQRCYFLTGKFDQYRRDVPYASLAGAFRGLMRQLLAETEGNVDAWRSRIRAALDINAQLIIDLVPELELLIGAQPPAPEMHGADARRRFFLAFAHFVAVFARPECPLVLFLDDLQWADAASLELLEYLVTTSRLRSFLLVGAYRDNDVGFGHPLTLMLESVQRSGIALHKLELGPLAPALVRQMTRDTMPSTRDVAPLAELLYRKTLGNPFFLIQLIKTLVNEGMIAFDTRTASWKWDLEQIENQDYSDNVADLMSRRIAHMSVETRRVMQLAAVLGARVDVRSLAVIAGYEPGAIRDVLEEAVREGLLLAHGGSYAFLHDRVRQAAYGMLRVTERPALHVRIGRRLLAKLPRDAVEAKVFEVVDQLNRGLELISDPSERLQIARLDLVAGMRAKASGAFVAAATYLASGISLLPADAWDVCYETAFALHIHAAESTYLAGRFADADDQLSQLVARARNSNDVVAAIAVRVDLLTAQGRIAEAIETALAGMNRFGLSLPRCPTDEQVDHAYRAMWALLGERSIESLAALPPMQDSEQQALFRLIMCVVPGAYFFDFHLYLLLASHQVMLCLRHGNAEAAAFGYAVLALCLIARFGRYAEAAGFVSVAAELAERSEEPRLKLRAWMPLWGLAGFWIRPYRDSLEGLRRCFRLGVQLSDLTYACYAGIFIAAVRLNLGDPLDDIAREHAEALDYARAMNFGMMTDAAIAQRQLLRSLRGETERFGSLNDASFDESAFERAVMGQPYTAAWYLVSKLQARFWAGDVEDAWSAAQALAPLREAMPAMPTYADYRYARALTIADRYASLSTEERAAGLGELREYQADLAALSRLCPENWRPRHALVSAELARIAGDVLLAEHAYEEAISAVRSDDVSHRALAYERAARFHRERGFELFADAYLREAHASYERWGAHGKVRQLEVGHPLLARSTSATGEATAPEALDAISIAKASRAISSAIVLADLQTVLLRLSMENAGACRGALLLAKQGRWMVEAALDVDRGGPPLPARPLSQVETVSQPLIAYVRRTRQPVVLDDAIRDPLFGATFARGAARRPRSVLCMPILRQDHLVGILYLENDLVAGAFSSDKLAIVEQLAAQAAISLENAHLYGDLRREIDERRAAQNALQANQALLQAIVDNSTAAIFVKDRAGHYLLVNSLWETTVGVSRHAALGRTDHEVFEREQADLFRANDELVFASEQPVEVDEPVLTTSGGRIYLALKFPLLDAAGRPYALCGIATDITERKRIEQALHDAIRVRDDFVRIASHELRTPLTPLQLQLELIQDVLKSRPDVTREQVADKLSLSLRQVGRLRSLVLELLDVSRLQSGRLELQLSEVDLCAVCRDVVRDLELELARSGTVVACECDASVVGRWDRSRLEQIITNLLTNAIKFGLSKPVEVAVRSSGGDAVLIVRDHGIGIASADQQRIFAPFERAVSTSYAGLGMGLYIAQAIVVAHGGTIAVTSTPGLGATFTVTLPQEPSRAGGVKQTSSPYSQ